MINYKIEYRLHKKNNISLVIVSNIYLEKEFTELSDYLFEIHRDKFKNININYFKNRDGANDYIYNKLVLDSEEIIALQTSGCACNFINNKLISISSFSQEISQFKSSPAVNS